MSTIRNSHGESLDHYFHEGSVKQLKEPRQPKERYLVILAHGLTGNKDRPVLRGVASYLSEQGWPCLRISYAGNGMSEGEFTESNISKNAQDLTAVLDQVALGKTIIYIGHSMGSAVGALTAVRDERIQALVSLAGLANTREFAERELSAKLVDEGNSQNQQVVTQNQQVITQQLIDDLVHIDSILPACAEIKRPWLLFHGLDDDEVFPSDSIDLFNVLRGKKQYIPIDGGDHLLEKEVSYIAETTEQWLTKTFLM